METTRTESPKPKPKPKTKTKGKRAPPANTNGSTALIKVDAAKPAKRKSPVPRSAEIEEIILEKLRDGGALKVICKTKGMPDESTVREWAMEDSPFAARYRRARELGYQKMADDLIALADDQGIEANSRRLMVDTRKWALAKALPKIYGDRLEVEAKAGIVVVKLDAEDLAL